MSSSAQQQQYQQQWAWLEDVNDLNTVTDEQVARVYMHDHYECDAAKCTARSCLDKNPHCLNHVGIRLWQPVAATTSTTATTSTSTAQEEVKKKKVPSNNNKKKRTIQVSSDSDCQGAEVTSDVISLADTNTDVDNDNNDDDDDNVDDHVDDHDEENDASTRPQSKQMKIKNYQKSKTTTRTRKESTAVKKEQVTVSVSEDGKIKQQRVGLVNLGATCYMNAFLQTWFYDVAFRQCVYSIPIMPDLVDLSLTQQNNQTDQIVRQLQILFGHLQQSRQSEYNPRKFVDALQLNDGEQQDANEFYRLFVLILERKMDDWGFAAGDGNFIRERFGGTYAHTTVCLGCHGKSTRKSIFTQIELNLKLDTARPQVIEIVDSDDTQSGGKKAAAKQQRVPKRKSTDVTLDGCLKDYLKHETLSGNNQYHCQSKCHSLQDAERYTELVTLPDVLNFQLMRFIVVESADDAAGYVKRKSNATIRFPLSIDMRKYVTTRERGVMYDLHAVLLHRGDSAYAGHYVAVVYDDQTGVWLKCNDSQCGPLNLQQADTQIFDIGAKDTDSAAGKKKLPCVDMTFRTDNVFCSKNAYMLMYKRRGLPTILEVPLPEHVQRAVNWSNGEYTLQMQRTQDHQRQRELAQEQQKQERLDIAACWQPQRHQMNYYLPTQWLQSWLKGSMDVDGFTFPMQCDVKLDGVPADRMIDARAIVCHHDRLKPNAAFKRISAEAYAKLQSLAYQMHPHPLTENDYCRECVLGQMQLKLREIIHHQQVLAVDMLVKQFDRGVTTQNNPFGTLKLHQLTHVPAQHLHGAGVWMSRKWLQQWLKKTYVVPADVADQFKNSHLEDVVCQHRHLNTNQGKVRQLVPQSVFAFFREEFQVAADLPVYYDHYDACKECQRRDDLNDVAALEAKAAASNERNELKSLLTGALDLQKLIEGDRSQSYHLVPQQFIDMWRQHVKQPVKHLKPIPENSVPLRCQHGLLRCDPNYYVSYGNFSEEPRLFQWETVSSQQQNASLFYRECLPKVASKMLGNDLVAPFYALTHQQLQALAAKYPVEAANAIEVRAKLVQYRDLATDKVRDNVVTVSCCSDEFGHDVCWPCWHAQLMDWEEASILINRIVDIPVEQMIIQATSNEFTVQSVGVIAAKNAEPVAKGLDSDVEYTDLLPERRARKPKLVSASSIYVDNSSSEEDFAVAVDSDFEDAKKPKRRKLVQTKLDPQNVTGVASQSSRASTNALRVINTKRSRRITEPGLLQMVITKQTRVLDLKVQLMHLLDLAPINQRLFLHGQEWNDNDKTLWEMDVLANSIIDLMIVPSSDEFGGGEHAVAAERGFKGTALGGNYDSSQATPIDLDSDAAVAPVPADTEDLSLAADSSHMQFDQDISLALSLSRAESVNKDVQEAPHSILRDAKPLASKLTVLPDNFDEDAPPPQQMNNHVEYDDDDDDDECRIVSRHEVERTPRLAESGGRRKSKRVKKTHN